MISQIPLIAQIVSGKQNKPYFGTKKSNCEERVLLVEDGKVVSNEDELAFLFNRYFNRITDSLDIPIIPELSLSDSNSISSAIPTYATHPSIVAIKERANINTPFEFKAVRKDMV